MIFHCYDSSTNSLLFRFSNSDDDHDCISPREVSENKACSCGSNRFFIVKKHESSGKTFAMCFDDINTRKKATFYAKQTIDMFLMSNQIIDARHDEYEEMVNASIHNTKNLNSQITAKILSYLREETFLNTSDKIAYIDNLIQRNTRGFAREVLSILKISSQISNEYNVIDYLKPGITIKKNEFGYKRVHGLLVISFYQFESEFIDKKIYVKIGKTESSVYINTNTVQTLLTHLFTNALRYTLPGSEIVINTSSISDDKIEISFQMRSLYLTDEILNNGLSNGTRCEQAIKMHKKGTGMGLGIVHTLSALNKGGFSFNRVSDKEYINDGFKYSDNCFKVQLLKNEFYN
jgi:signal transduction histidine kinase